jgi:hypothetical protein
LKTKGLSKMSLFFLFILENFMRNANKFFYKKIKIFNLKIRYLFFNINTYIT